MFDESSEVLYVKWHDNSMVTIGINHQSMNPVGTAKRWCKKKENLTNIPQPDLIAKYNKYMGVVDHLDWMIQKYSTDVKMKNWYFKLFTNYLDTAAVNTWILSTLISGTQTSLLEFKCSISR